MYVTLLQLFLSLEKMLFDGRLRRHTSWPHLGHVSGVGHGYARMYAVHIG